jgi:hypothetical protein
MQRDKQPSALGLFDISDAGDFDAKFMVTVDYVICTYFTLKVARLTRVIVSFLTRLDDASIPPGEPDGAILFNVCRATVRTPLNQTTAGA